MRSFYYPLYRYAYRKLAKKSEIVLSELKATEAITKIAYGKTTPQKKVILSEWEATEAIVQTALSNPAFVERYLKKNTKSIIKNILNRPEIVEEYTKKCIESYVEENTVSIVKDALNDPKFVKKFLKVKKPYSRHDQEIWNEYFRNKPEELEKLQNQLIANTDELSCEVVARFIERRRFLERYGNNKALWNLLAETVWRHNYPLDCEKQKYIGNLDKSYHSPYKLPTVFQEHMATHFGLNQFPVEIQKQVAGKDIIDGGGFTGDSAMVFTEYNPKKVYVFEPNPGGIPGIQKILAENATVLGDRKDGIDIVPFALGKSKGKLTLYFDGEFDASATTLPGRMVKVHEQEVDVVSIDGFVKEHSLDIGLIKLDIQGVEYDTILGAKETIIKQRPLLIISIYHTFKDFFEIKPLIESWGAGYKLEIRHNKPEAPNSEFVLMGHVEK